MIALWGMSRYRVNEASKFVLPVGCGSKIGFLMLEFYDGLDGLLRVHLGTVTV